MTVFPPTRLSVVERKRSGDEQTRQIALATIIEAYWKPAYKYLRVKWSLDPDAAADLTQEFFASTLEKEVVSKYDPARARFRTYLRLCLDGFASNARKAERRLKRGGGATMVPLDFETAEGEIVSHEPSVDADVDDLFYREWVRALLERSVADLRKHADAAGRPQMFSVFEQYDLIGETETRPTYAEIARTLNLTAATVTNHLAAMRRQFRQIVLERLRELTSSEEEWEAEAARLLGGRAATPTAGWPRGDAPGRPALVISDRAVARLRDAAAWPELDARYEITGVAGHGGMGTVYIARDHVLDRDVAVKVIDLADHKGSRAARLQRESHILARLDHPAIVPIHDAGSLEDGRAFYVMKLVKGRRLDDLLRDEVPIAERLNAFTRVLDAVAFAHAHGIVHRDLKPENVMVGGFGEVYVMDWGVAQDGGADAEAAVVGTPGFMAPEQEAASGAVDRRADVFALGEMLKRLIGDEAPPPLRAIAGKARHPAPDARYQSVEALAADLARFRNQDPVEAHSESVVERAVRIYRRYELPILLLLAYVVMRFALMVFRGI